MTARGAALVVDASVAAKWVLEEPGSDWARGLRMIGAQLMAPNLLCAECGNALWRMVRAKRIEASLLGTFWSAMNAVPFSAACFLCSSAYFSRAPEVGSLTARKLKNELPLFLLFFSVA